MDDQLAHLAFRRLLALLIHDLRLPVVARLSDGPYLMDIFHSQMDAAWPYRFAQAIIGIILMMRKMLLPALDQTGR